MISILLSHRGKILFLLFLLTVMFSWFALGLKVDPGVESLLPSGGKSLQRLREFNETFGADEVIVLALHSPHLFTSEGLKRLDALTREASRLPHVARVLSPTTLEDLDGDELGPSELVPYEKVERGEWSPEELGRRLAAHPLFGGVLVSADAHTAAILIEVQRSEVVADFRASLVERVRALATHAGEGIEAHVAGIPVEKVDVAGYVRHDQLLFAPLILAFLAVVTFVLYRHPTGVLVPLGVVAASLLWTLGLYAASGKTLNPVTALITPVILIVGVAGAIHFLNHYLAARAEELPKEEALRRAFALSRVPCFNAALTTAIGFGSLLWLPIPAIREFGIFSAAGVMIAAVFTLILAPLLIAQLPDFPPRIIRDFRPGPVERAMRGITAAVARHPVLTGLGAAAVLGLSVLGLSRIQIETDLIRSMRSDSPLARATQFIDGHLTGVNSLEILIPESSIEDPAHLARIARFEEAIRGLPDLRKVTGYPDIAARVNRAFHKGDDAYARLPEGSEASSDLRDIQDLLKSQAPAELARFVSPDGHTLRLAARVGALDTRTSQRLFAAIRRAASECGIPRVVLTGNFVVFSDMSTSLVRNQIQGVLPALVLILGALAVQLRSLRLGLLSAIPTGSPVLLTYAVMGWIGIPLSVSTAMIAGVALGMTDDNTIHLLSRFRQAFHERRDYEQALEAMMDDSGRAVLFSTLIVVLGFMVGAFSSFQPSVHFAVLTGLTLLLGLFCELVLLPLTLILFKPLGRPGVPGRIPANRAAVILSLAILLVGTPGLAPALAAEPPLLKDQFGQSDGPTLHRGAPLLLTYGEPPDLRRMKSWELKITERSGPGLQVLRAVDARGVYGKKTEAEVNDRLRKNVPKEIAILVDWHGELARAFSLPASQVSATLLDPAGKACATLAGPVRNDTATLMLDLLARVRAKGSCP